MLILLSKSFLNCKLQIESKNFAYFFAILNRLFHRKMEYPKFLAEKKNQFQVNGQKTGLILSIKITIDQIGKLKRFKVKNCDRFSLLLMKILKILRNE